MLDGGCPENALCLLMVTACLLRECVTVDLALLLLT